MGHLTTVELNAEISKDIPLIKLRILRTMLTECLDERTQVEQDKDKNYNYNVEAFVKHFKLENEEEINLLKEELKHPFFSCPRCWSLFTHKAHKDILIDEDYMFVQLDSEFKCYDKEVDLFADWVGEYLNKEGDVEQPILFTEQDTSVGTLLNTYDKVDNKLVKVRTIGKYED